MTVTTLVLVTAAAAIMIRAAVAKRRLVLRGRRCPVCGRPQQSCICYWR
jgi:hypothetical protein